jgi:ATP-dependent exoDNAse (exonuclease V) alpha subunit
LFKLTWVTRLKLYSSVRLLTDAYQPIDAFKGDIGTIIEIYPDSEYEVEFSRTDGTTYAQIVARAEELELAEPVPTEPALS